MSRSRNATLRPGAAVSRRTRMFVGTVLMIALIFCWSLFFMAVAQGRIADAGRVWQFLYYVVAGLGWVVPAGLLIRWMQRPEVS